MLRHLVGHGSPFGSQCGKHPRRQWLADAGAVRGNHRHPQSIGLRQFPSHRLCRTRHSTQMPILAEERLHGHPGCLPGGCGDRQVLAGLNRLVQAILPLAAVHHPAGRFIDNHHLVVGHHVVPVPLKAQPGGQRPFDSGMDPLGVERGEQRWLAQQNHPPATGIGEPGRPMPGFVHEVPLRRQLTGGPFGPPGESHGGRIVRPVLTDDQRACRSTVATFTISPNAAVTFLTLEDARDRAKRGRGVNEIVADLRQKMTDVNEAQIFVIQPPPVRGIGRGGGFKIYVQDQSGAGIAALDQVSSQMMEAANQQPGLAQVYSNFRVGVPQVYADVDRVKTEMLEVPVDRVFETMQIYLGSLYVNDFNLLGRTYRVTAQAEPEFRDQPEDILRLRTRSNRGATIPLGSVVDLKRTAGPDRIVRFNLYPAADLNGDTVPGYSTGQSLSTMERLADESLPPGFGYAWTELAYQERQAGNTIVFLFPLAVLFVFLTLAAQYESWLLPLAIILIVPLCLLFALVGIWFRGMDNNILTQIGFIVLVGLACKNAILIVEFAKAEEDAGKDRFQAAVDACRLRLRPILMTAFSFILGVIPLLLATGAGFEMRRVLGTAVFSGMLGVTLFGLFLTPVFYVVLRGLARKPALATAGGVTVDDGAHDASRTAAAASTAPVAGTEEPAPQHSDESPGTAPPSA